MSSINIFTVVIILFIMSCTSTPALDPKTLTAELDSILIEDQRYRSDMQSLSREYGWNSPQMRSLFKKQSVIDSSNLQRIITIIDQLDGYPGTSLVGHSAGKTAFYVLQHSPDTIQAKYLDLIIKAANDNEIDRGLAAMYVDRVLVNQERPQIYGTQLTSKTEIDSLTGERTNQMSLWPIADTTKIDSIRLWNGLGPLEEYVNGFGASRWD